MLAYCFYVVGGFCIGMYASSFRTAFLACSVFHWLIYKPWRDSLAPTIEYDLKYPAIFCCAILSGCAAAWAFCCQPAFDTLLLLPTRKRPYNRKMLERLAAGEPGLGSAPDGKRRGGEKADAGSGGEGAEQNPLTRLYRELVPSPAEDERAGLDGPQSRQQEAPPDDEDLRASSPGASCLVRAYRLSMYRPLAAAACTIALVGATVPLSLESTCDDLWAGIVTVSLVALFSALAFFASRSSSPAEVYRALFYDYASNVDTSVRVYALCGPYLVAYCAVHWTLTYFVAYNAFYISLGFACGGIALFFVAGLAFGTLDRKRIPW